MNNAALETGMVVSFGRNRGEHTLGEVVRVTRKSVKVRQLESRGAHKTYAVGSLWLVPKEMVQPAKVSKERIEEAKKALPDTPPSPTLVIKREDGMVPVAPANQTGDESVATKSKATETVKTVETVRATGETDKGEADKGAKGTKGAKAQKSHTPIPGAPRVDVSECPVLIDPISHYQFIGQKGEDLASFITRIKDMVH